MVTPARDTELDQAGQAPLSRLTELAQEDQARQFSSIAHFLTPEALQEAFRSLRKDASAGVDDVTYQDYQRQSEENMQRLWERLKSKTYRAQTIVRKFLMEMIEQRISDRSILRLIGKWINIGVIDEGRLLDSATGIGQGQVISPFLANVYLHWVLDRWFEDEVKPRLKGKAFVVRYVDDAVICFQNEEDAQKALKTHRHEPVKEQQATLNAKLRGHYQYYGRASNYRSLWQFFRAVRAIWRKWLTRRTRGTSLSWDQYQHLLQHHPLVFPRIVHTWVSLRSPL